jgi:acyl carrier protein
MTNATHPPPSIQNRVFDLVAEECDVPRESLDRATTFPELGDSLTRVEAVMEIEDAFEIALPDDEADHVRTLGELVDVVDAKVRARENAEHDDETTAADAPPGT